MANLLGDPPIGVGFVPRSFTTVFDVSHERYAMWWVPAYGLVFVIAGALMVFRPDLMRNVRIPGGSNSVVRKGFGWTFFVFASLWTASAFFSTFRRDEAMTSALRRGRYDVVAGEVTNFKPMPYGGHARESFTVEGRTFSYSDYIGTGGFNNTASHGGPIHAGLYVRIACVGDIILRLEIGQ